MTVLSDSEAELLHSALRSEMPKEPLASSPDKDGVYSYVIGATDYFASAHLPRQGPERMMVSCALDPSLGLQSVVISDLKSGHAYCQAHFEPPHMATQTPASEQAPSSMAGQPPSRTHLSVFSNSDLMKELIQGHNPQDEELRQGSGASVSTQSRVFSHNGSAGASAEVSRSSRNLRILAPRSTPNQVPSLPSRSGATSESQRPKRQKVTDAQIDALLYNDDGETFRTNKEIGRLLRTAGFSAGDNRIQGRLQALAGLRQLPGATDEKIREYLHDPEDGSLRTQQEVISAMREDRWGAKTHRIVAQMQAAGVPRHLTSATDEQIQARLYKDNDDNDGRSLRTCDEIANALNEDGLGARNARIQAQLRAARGQQ
ncbi:MULTISPECIES: hypothetical protein [Pseudomonas]|uniref:Uncharacterized protein n=1 Tax=Pseudomonas quercus TaxID=2722792 RepID=A0ABX0YD77_9PSED|nr:MULTISPECIES: hypothetical protein [Pseudomonas]MBF7142742.1 hypothetical protein [Pseudomonas sp. LY10J]NJP01280.1 hypothetical protein [Pseudomonas quercus]